MCGIKCDNYLSLEFFSDVISWFFLPKQQHVLPILRLRGILHH